MADRLIETLMWTAVGWYGVLIPVWLFAQGCRTFTWLRGDREEF